MNFIEIMMKVLKFYALPSLSFWQYVIASSDNTELVSWELVIFTYHVMYATKIMLLKVLIFMFC